jgi:hypothetical protein
MCTKQGDSFSAPLSLCGKPIIPDLAENHEEPENALPFAA